jgi:glutaredoxin
MRAGATRGDPARVLGDVRGAPLSSKIRAMRTRFLGVLVAVAAAATAIGCGGTGEPEPGTGAAAAVARDGEGEIVIPPFDVSGDAEGLLLTWFDERGVHLATARQDIPEERRGQVRVDSLDIPPDERDPEYVYVADLRAPGENGRYVVRRLRREEFDRLVERFGDAPEAPPAPAAPGSPASGEVVVFGASWCGACREVEAFLRSRGIPFVERDVERDPSAREDMLRRAARAGIRSTAIPIIDFRGRIIQGFDRAALERAIRETGAAGGGGSNGITI